MFDREEALVLAITENEITKGKKAVPAVAFEDLRGLVDDEESQGFVYAGSLACFAFVVFLL